MIKNLFVILIAALLTSQNAFSQLSQNEKDAFISKYSDQYNPEALTNLLNDPEKGKICQECAKSINDLNSFKKIKDFADKASSDSDLEIIYRQLGIGISDEYSRKIMPGFNISDYQDEKAKVNIFEQKNPNNPTLKEYPYSINYSNYELLVESYSSDRRNNFSPDNAFSSMEFQYSDMLKNLSNDIRGADYNNKDLTNNQVDAFIKFWLEKSHYNKLLSDVRNSLSEDMSITEQKIKVCNEIVRKLIEKSGNNENTVITQMDNNEFVETTTKDVPKIENKDNTENKSDWIGTWVQDGNTSTVNISGSAAFYTATFEYQVGDAKGNGSWDDCKVTGNTMKGSWTADHEDDTKNGSRKGTFEVTLENGVITGKYDETEDPKWNYKSGFNKENVNSSMKKGATFSIHMSKK